MSNTATIYLENNNAGRVLLVNYNNEWFYDIKSYNYLHGRYGNVDIYACNEDNETLSIEEIAPQLAEFFKNEADIDEWYIRDIMSYVEEFDGMTIDDIDKCTNFNSDGTPIGHDETIWAKVCDIDI